MRACGFCGADLDDLGLRADAKYCSAAHKVAAARQRHTVHAFADLQAIDFARVLDHDPCVFCGTQPAGGVVSIDSHPGSPYTWENLTAACQPCAARKGTKRLLTAVGRIR